jgi:hypothetical protein
MAVFALTNEYLSINAVVLSDHVKSAVLTVDTESLDATAMGPGWKAAVGGLKGGQLAITFNDDYAASNVDATIWAALGTVVAFEVRPDAGAVSPTNPKFTGSVLIAQTAVGGSVGELAAKQVTFPTSGAVTRATA